jgi:IS30 family transposase
MELRARGWFIRAAAREVGVSPTSGANCARGHNVYRNGVVVGFVAPLDRLAVRKISSRYLSQDERIEIADLRQSGPSLRAIGSRLGSDVRRRRRSHGSCGATRLPVAGIARSTPINVPPCGGRACQVVRVSECFVIG